MRKSRLIMANHLTASYTGFEQGAIRPPNEARSLLIRVTRNCPWNRCTFCPVYKDARFSIRPVEHVKRDIDLVAKHVDDLRRSDAELEPLSLAQVRRIARETAPEESEAFAVALGWLANDGAQSVFLQDADALATKTANLVAVLEHLEQRFPFITRVTAYSRARTIASKRDGDLQAMKDAGLTRLHVGLESGSDEVLKLVAKGSTKKQQIAAGRKAKSAGLELSEYVMPGLGGKRLSELHAIETADALNQIDPDFIRFRTLAITHRAPLYAEHVAGRFEKCTDLMVARELLMLMERLEGISSTIASDHVVNLFADLEGRLPEDKERLLAVLRSFLGLGQDRQRQYQVGRRLGIVSTVADLEDTETIAAIDRACLNLGITADNADDVIDSLMARYV